MLAALEDLRVRAMHFTQSQRLSLGEVGLEEASSTGRGGPASTVEVCSCPPAYSGDSCQVRASEQGLGPGWVDGARHLMPNMMFKSL